MSLGSRSNHSLDVASELWVVSEAEDRGKQQTGQKETEQAALQSAGRYCTLYIVRRV